ncbi:DUF3601 domain-containing protein [Aurantiacibacter sp. MUD11]|uniref:DUF3601 domain-containing protein n=1 Tax=Aurantiacibacter sp. MUD11 TaxID=3003265 RepID=UPI0022AA8F78|nr:DUF3601 domain-containing protein [Aurantiacibacter sp. MUD11]WAT18411.1 DUF3601 domain-containing protein [Aurantiacibacter sp. MUD11]
MQQSSFKHLVVGERYRVIAEFEDFDEIAHSVGECWTFRGHNFLPYEDGLSLFVESEDGTERHVRLQWRPEAQGSIIDRLERYVARD